MPQKQSATNDPYAAYGGSVANDPYAAYGGRIAAAPSAPEMSEVLGLPPGMSLPGVPGVPLPKQLQNTTMNSIQDAVGGFGMGVIKGGAHTLNTLGRLATHGAPDSPSTQEFFHTDPNNSLPEKLGYGGEQVGEFFLLPGGKLGKAAKALSGSEKIGYGGKLLGEALATGAVNKAQGGDFTQGAEMGALGGAAGDALGYGLRKGGAFALDHALNISGAKLRRTNPGQYLVENTPFPRYLKTASGMRDQANEDAKGVYDQILNKAEGTPNNVNLQPTLDEGQKFLTQFMSQNNSNLVTQADNVMDVAANTTVDGPMGRFTVPRGNPNPATMPPTLQQQPFGGIVPPAPNNSRLLSVPQALTAKRGLGAARSWNGNNFFEPPVTTMRDAMYGRAAQSIEDAAPGMSDLNNAYSNLATVGDSIDRKASLWPMLHAMGFGGVGGAIMGHGNVETALSALGSGVAYKGLSSAPAGYLIGKSGFMMPTAARAGRNAFLVVSHPDGGTQ